MRLPFALFAGACLAITACGGGGDQAASCTKAVSGTREEFTFRVDPVKPGEEADAQKTADAMCERLRAIDGEGVQVRVVGARRIRVVARNDERAIATADFISRPVSFQFYDWEPNVLGKAGPERPFSGSRALYDAAVVASKSRPMAEATDVPSDRGNDATGTRYYVFDAQRRPLRSDGKPLPPGSLPRLAATPSPPRRRDLPAGAAVVKVPEGVTVVQAERRPNQPATVQRFFVLEDDSELSGADVRNPKQTIDPRTNQPAITMQFTDAGRTGLARATRREAERGARVGLPAGASRSQAFQHFAITADGEVLSLPAIDFVANPHGIDGRTGAQIQGLGSLSETRLLATALQVGALPAETTLISLERRG